LWLHWPHDNANFQTLSDERLPRTYDPLMIQVYWGEHPRIAVRRVLQIAGEVSPFLARLVYCHCSGDLKEPEVQQRLAIDFRLLLTRLGPTFIKFGQMLSIRPDVLPPVAVYEMQKLCDSVPAFPTSIALRTIEEELNLLSVEQLFEGLNEESLPIAAASLGQVYRCRLRVGGTMVALKVQRPDMLKTVSLDLYILRKYCHFVEGVKAQLMAWDVMASRRQFDVELLDTFAGASYQELDYVQEGKNQERFTKELVPKVGSSKLHVPAVYWVATSNKVLASEWIDGVQLARSSPEVIRKLVAVGVQTYLTQLLDTGFFHSDPHPGNLLVDKQGRLVLIDFGLCASVSRPDTEGMTAAIVHLMNGQMEGLLQDAVLLGFLPENVDRESLVPVLQRIYDAGQLKAKEMVGNRAMYRSSERRKHFSAISHDLNQVFFDYPFTVPSYFALITRALITLEGIALTGDPSFDIFHASYPFARRHAVEVFGFRNINQVLQNSPIPLSQLVKMEAQMM